MIKLLAVGLSLAVSVAPALAAELRVTVNGVRSDAGEVRVALYRSAEGFATPEGIFLEVIHPARTGSVEAVFVNVPPGTYGLASFHDENGNGAFDTSFLGIPEEGFGFGNDAPVTLGPPDFEDATVTVADSPAAHGLTLRYW